MIESEAVDANDGAAAEAPDSPPAAASPADPNDKFLKSMQEETARLKAQAHARAAETARLRAEEELVRAAREVARVKTEEEAAKHKAEEEAAEALRCKAESVGKCCQPYPRGARRSEGSCAPQGEIPSEPCPLRLQAAVIES